MRSKTATDRLSEFKLATSDVLKRIGTARRLPASSCNALLLSFFYFLTRPSLSETVQRPPIKCMPEVRSYAPLLQSTETSPHPSPNFYRGSKSAIFGVIAEQRLTLSPCGLESEQDTSLPSLRCVRCLCTV